MTVFDEATAYRRIAHRNNPYYAPDLRAACPSCESVLTGGAVCGGCKRENERRKS